jgi:DNA polymerase-3 subunit delta'
MARYQVIILNGAQRLTEEAGNLLLKSLEEPPAQARFLLITAQPTACLATIVSRCKVIRFQRLSAQTIETLLMSRQACPPEVVPLISRLAQGSASRALELAQGWERYQTMVAHLGSEHVVDWLGWSIPTDRKAISRWLACAIFWLRDLAVTCVTDDDSLVYHHEATPSLRRQARMVDHQQCVETAMRLVELWESLEQMASPRLVGTLLREEWLALLQDK